MSNPTEFTDPEAVHQPHPDFDVVTIASVMPNDPKATRKTVCVHCLQRVIVPAEGEMGFCFRRAQIRVQAAAERAQNTRTTAARVSA
jgi:hypothetical protein